MTQFGATDLLKNLMAHYPRDFFPGMDAEMKTALYDSFMKHFGPYEDSVVLEALDDWIEMKSTTPTIFDLLRILSGKLKPERERWFHTMGPAEIKLCRQISKYGWTDKDGTHYEGAGVKTAYQDLTVDGSEDRIGEPFQDFFDYLKLKIKLGELI